MSPLLMLLFVSGFISFTANTQENNVISGLKDVYCGNYTNGCDNKVINFPSNSDCTINCDPSCDSTIINATNTNKLSINNCNNYNISSSSSSNSYQCHNMTIYCPINKHDRSRRPNTCKMNGIGYIANTDIYTEEGFYDLYTQNTLKMFQTVIYCGESTNNYECIINKNGTSCDNTAKDLTCNSFIMTTTDGDGNIADGNAIPNDIDPDPSKNIDNQHDDIVIYIIIILSILFVCISSIGCYWKRKEKYYLSSLGIDSSNVNSNSFTIGSNYRNKHFAQPLLLNDHGSRSCTVQLGSIPNNQVIEEPMDPSNRKTFASSSMDTFIYTSDCSIYGSVNDNNDDDYVELGDRIQNDDDNLVDILDGSFNTYNYKRSCALLSKSPSDGSDGYNQYIDIILNDNDNISPDVAQDEFIIKGNP